MARDSRQTRPEEAISEPLVYLPYRAKPMPGLIILARAGVPPTSLATAIRNTVQKLDTYLPVFQVQTLDEFFALRRWPFRVFGTLFAVFALIALLAHGLRQLALGLAVGLAAAFGVARVMKSLLVQISPTDPLTFATIPAVLIVVGVLACWMPARWAMKVNPIIALRYE